MNLERIKRELINAGKSLDFERSQEVINSIPKDAVMDDQGNSLMSFLVNNGLEAYAAWYLEQYKPDTMKKNKYGKNTLQIATDKHLYGLIDILSSKDDIESVDNNGMTCLITAIINSDIEAVKILLKKNSSPNVCDKHGLNGFAYAILLQNKDMLDLLLSYTLPKQTTLLLSGIPDEYVFIPLQFEFPYKTTLLHLAVLTGDTDILSASIRLVDDMHETDSNGCTALDIAAKLNLADFCYILSSFGSKVPLFEAIKDNDFPKFAATLGPYANCIDKDGCTPLHYAVKYERLEMVRAIAGRFPVVPDFNGVNPYEIASDEIKEVLARSMTSKTIFGFSENVIGSSAKRIRFSLMIDAQIHQLDAICMILKMYSLYKTPQHPTSIIGLSLIEAQPKLRKILEVLKFEMDFHPLEQIIEKIISSQQFENFISIFSDLSAISKAKESDNIIIWLANSVIFAWIKVFVMLFEISTNVYNFPPSRTSSFLLRFIQNYIQVDDVLYSMVTKGKTEIPRFRRVYMIMKVSIVDSMKANVDCGDKIIKEKVCSLFMDNNDHLLMMTPCQNFINDGQYIFMVTEGTLIFISTTFSFIVPLFGLYFKTKDNSNKVTLTWHAGSVTVVFDDSKIKKMFVDLIKALTKKYEVPDVFMANESAINKPVWLVFSYIYNKANIPSLTLKAAIVKSSLGVVDEANNFYRNLSNVKRNTLRCQVFEFPLENVSQSLLGK